MVQAPKSRAARHKEKIYRQLGREKAILKCLTMARSSKQKILGNTEILQDTSTETDPVATFQPRASEPHSAFFLDGQEYSLGELTQVHKASISKFKVKVI